MRSTDNSQKRIMKFDPKKKKKRIMNFLIDKKSCNNQGLVTIR